MTWPSSGGIVFICDRWSLPWKGVPRNIGLLPDTLNYGLCIHHNSQANWAMMCHITHCNSTSASKRKGHQSPVGWHQLTSRCGHGLNNLTSTDLKAPLVIWRDPWIFDAEICVALIWWTYWLMWVKVSWVLGFCQGLILMGFSNTIELLQRHWDNDRMDSLPS